MCSCVNVDFGSYANQSTVKFPFYPASSVHETVCIDNCILAEVEQLWEQDIQTTNSCCGHNKLPGTILVIPEHIDKMLELGYEKYRHPVMNRTNGQPALSLNDRHDIFFAQSVERIPFPEVITW